eukprot:TRINITY_DN22076_c0_g2_i1.p1 TRINITY_DN22076_c0_g2~~TRINITY_DN22076_c0_g2_i1.p1  ORF type:complete len:1306 (-),score=298.41 TRINITY_DN22076_c0_g2_i1:24-3941(-)
MVRLLPWRRPASDAAAPDVEKGEGSSSARADGSTSARGEGGASARGSMSSRGAPSDYDGTPRNLQRTPRSGANTARSDRSDRSGRSGSSLFSRGSRKKPLREKVLASIKEEEGGSRMRRLLTGHISRSGQDRERMAGRALLKESEAGIDAEAEDWELLDIVEELGLTLEPVAEELGDLTLLEQKKKGILDPTCEETITRYKRHKALQGRQLFEAESANNLGVEAFNLGDLEMAQVYFKKALELSNVQLKPAAEEIQKLKDFIKDKFYGDEKLFQTAMAEGEARFALGRKRFATQLVSLGFEGDADRVFAMADSIEQDGKITMVEIGQLLRARQAKVNDLDRDVLQKGVILNNIAVCHVQWGEYTTGLQRLREAMKIVIRQALGGEDDPIVQRVMGNIVTAYIHQGNLDAALNYLSDILRRRESISGAYDESVLYTLYQTGYCFLVKANRFEILHDCQRPDGKRQEDPVELNYKLALLAFKERLRRQQIIVDYFNEESAQAPGELDQLRLEVARSSEIIAEIHEQRGELDRALPFMLEAVAIKEETLDEMDPEQLTTWNILAMMCMKAGQFSEALSTMRKAAAATAVLFGDPSAALATELYHIGLILFKLGSEQVRDDPESSLISFSQSLEQLERVVEMQTEFELDADLSNTLQLIGSVHLAARNRVEARRHFSKALISRIEVYGRSHVATASSAHALGTLYSRTPRRANAAVKLLQMAASVRKLLLGSDSLHLAESLHELGSALLLRRDRKDAVAALQHLSEAAKIREERLGKESVPYAASLHQLGQAYMHIQNFGEARMYLLAAVTLRESLLGRKNAQTAASKYLLGICLYHLNEAERSLKYLKASYGVREGMFGKYHQLSADSLHQIGIAHTKKKELDFALPFFLEALKIRKDLNDRDTQIHEEDSDQEVQAARKTSPRDVRIRKKRELARKQALALEKERVAEEKRMLHEEKAEKQKKEKERKKEKARKKALKAKREGKPQASGWSIKNLFKRGADTTEDGDEEGGQQVEDLKDSEASSSPRSGAGSPRSGEGSPRQGGSPKTSARSGSSASLTGSPKTGSPKTAGSGVSPKSGGEPRSPKTMESSTRSGEDRKDSSTDLHEEDDEICTEECGVDVKGFLAGPVGDSMHLIAQVYMEKGEYKEAKYYLDRALCIRSEVFGEVSAEAGETLQAFGDYYFRQANFANSLKFYRSALRTREQACGFSALPTAESCASLVYVLMKTTQVDEAGLFMTRACRIRENHYGKDDPIAKDLREAYNLAVSEQMHHDPVVKGDVLPHFAYRSAESYLHGYKDRQDGPAEEV